MSQERYPGLDNGDANQVISELETGHQAAGEIPVTEVVEESNGSITVIDHI
ncbi:hypothetical protein NE236_37055 [Actinoallomurus purpureus]|uniref:hypothetical protein n=1 Tax=Actinoallomurus purpureus TaxID=478114 RepID=UPI002092079C|nr:hypothetical protein [Actinoallomurus purpureus]MCO6010582.1 hypothetical protein [Actinoallomurus purpureus]